MYNHSRSDGRINGLRLHGDLFLTESKPGFIRAARSFIIIWAGQSLSIIGSGLSGFAIGLWLYQISGSMTLFAVNMAANVLPSILLGPFASMMVDHYPRRPIILIADTGAALSTVGILLLLRAEQPPIAAIILLGLLLQVLTTFQSPAYHDVAMQLLPEGHVDTGWSLINFSDYLARLLSPALAGFMLVLFDLRWALIADLASFAIAIVAGLIVPIPNAPVDPFPVHRKETVANYLRDAWELIKDLPGVILVLFHTAFDTFILNAVFVVIPPMVISLSGPAAAGVMEGVKGAGLLLGTIMIAAWGLPRRKLDGYLTLALGGLVLLFALGLLRDPLALGLALFLLMLIFPVMNGSAHTLLSDNIPVELHEKVFSLRQLAADVVVPVAYLTAGPLADYVFQPLLETASPFADLVSALVGSGEGRGAALVILIGALLGFIVTIILRLHPHVRRLEKSLPSQEA